MAQYAVPILFAVTLLMLIAVRLWAMYKRDVNGFWRTMNSLQLEIVNGIVVSRKNADFVADHATCANLQAHYDRYILNYEEDDREYPWFQILAAICALGGYAYTVFFRG